MTQINIIYQGNLRTECTHTGNGQTIVTDAPKDNHGKGEYFSPTDLAAAALASCMITIMGIEAQKINVDLNGTKASVTKEMTTTAPRRIKKLTVKITCPQDFEFETRARLERAALGCPIKHSLHPDVEQECTFEWGV